MDQNISFPMSNKVCSNRFKEKSMNFHIFRSFSKYYYLNQNKHIKFSSLFIPENNIEYFQLQALNLLLNPFSSKNKISLCNNNRVF